MREALARSDHDFVLSEPRARGVRPRVTVGAVLLGCLRLAYRAAAYPNRVAAALLIAILIAILVNALMLQNSRHPAPLFGRSIPVAPAAIPVATEKPEPAPQQTPDADSQKPASDPITQILKANSAPHAATAPSLRKQIHADAPLSETKPAHDPITQILKARETQATAPESNKTVLAAQRALVRLGYVLRPDGVNGAATRQALEQFERDHGLPAKGEFTPKVLHELAAQSGQPIE